MLSYMFVFGWFELFFEMFVIVIGFKFDIDDMLWFVKKVMYMIGDGGFMIVFEFEVCDVLKKMCCIG